MPDEIRPSEVFERHRSRLLGLAYRMLGTRADAEDAVQDAWLRWSAADRSAVLQPEAFLVRTLTRLCLDRLKAVRHQREVYPGPWLPEPVVDAEALSPHTATELADDLSFALLLALDRLSPLERAAFLLHDVFDLSFAEVADALERSEPACRQLAARARKSVRRERPAPKPSEEHRRLLVAFVTATASGDLGQLQSLLTEDVVALSDGGGRVLAALNPIVGADKVARFLVGAARKFMPAEARAQAEATTLNGSPALLVYVDDQLQQTVMIDVDKGRIARLYVVRNPDKLSRLATHSADIHSADIPSADIH